MKRRSKLAFFICAAFFGFRVLLILLDWQDLKYMIPQNVSPGEAAGQLMSVGKVQYDIVMLIVSILFPYAIFRYRIRNARKESGYSSEPESREETRMSVGLKMLIHVLSFGVFQYCMLTLYMNDPATSSEILNWLWKPLLALLLDYLLVRFLLPPPAKKYRQWRSAELVLAFFACTIVMDILTSGFMWSSSWRRLYSMNFIFEALLVAERALV